MSSLIRRIETRIMAKANVEKVFSHMNGDERVFVWPRLIPAYAMPEKKPHKRAFHGAYRKGREERGRRRGKHSANWIKARADQKDAT